MVTARNGAGHRMLKRKSSRVAESGQMLCTDGSAPCLACTRKHAALTWRPQPANTAAPARVRPRRKNDSQFRLSFPNTIRAAFFQNFPDRDCIKRRVPLPDHQGERVIGNAFRDDLFLLAGRERRARKGGTRKPGRKAVLSVQNK